MSVQYQVLPSKEEEIIWIAQKIQELQAQGQDLSEIALIARRHKDLENAAKILEFYSLPLAYERSENVLQQAHIIWVIQILRFIQGLGQHRLEEADELLPEILSYPFWGISNLSIYKIAQRASTGGRRSWLEIMQDFEEEKVRKIAEFLLDLAVRAKTETAEKILDRILGVGSEISLENGESSLSLEELEAESGREIEEEMIWDS